MPSVSACRSTGHLHSTGRALGDRGRRARYTSVWRNPLPVRCVLSARQLGCLRRFNKAVRITGLSCSSQVRTVVGVKRCVRASRVACLGGRYGIIRARGPAPRTPALCRLWDGPPTARPAVARSFFAQERLYRKDLRTMPMCLFYDILDHAARATRAVSVRRGCCCGLRPAEGAPGGAPRLGQSSIRLRVGIYRYPRPLERRRPARRRRPLSTLRTKNKARGQSTRERQSRDHTRDYRACKMS